MAIKWQSPRKNFSGEKIDFEIFGSKYVLKHSESIPTKKNFSTKNFCLCFFVISHFGQKVTESQEIFKRDFFSIFRFLFKIRFEAFWTDSIPKKMFNQKNLILSFCILLAKKWVPGKRFYSGKKFWSRDLLFKIPFEIFWMDSDKKFRTRIFDIAYLAKKLQSPRKRFWFRDFQFKYVLIHCESILTKKNSTKIFDFAIFSTFLALEITFLAIFEFF